MMSRWPFVTAQWRAVQPSCGGEAERQQGHRKAFELLGCQLCIRCNWRPGALAGESGSASDARSRHQVLCVAEARGQ